MSIFLAEEFERFTKDLPDAVSLEFFCDNKNNKRNTADSIIQGLVFQLLHKRNELFKHILPTFEIQKASLFSDSSFQSLWRIFEDMICDPILRTIYCVLDGLDECDEASLEFLLRHFKALFSKDINGTGSCHLNLFIVSRDRPDVIRKLLSGFPRIRMDGDADNEVNQDITRFIDAKLDHIFSVGGYPQSTRVKVKNIFRERAQGTFLWIGIAAKTLKGYNAIEFETALEGLPPGLDELYSRMLLGIRVDHRQIAASILRWVVMAIRPLTLSELSAIIKPIIEPPIGFTREDVTKNQVSYCGYFLTIKGCEVSLIHQSAKDYLLSGDRDSNPELNVFRMEEKAGNLEVARKCLQYLEDNLLARGDIDPERKISHLEAFPLLSYATRYWHIHARSLPRSDDVFDLSRAFYHDKSRIRELWLETYRDFIGSYGKFPNSFELLHIASYFGILPLVERLLTPGGFSNKRKRLRSIDQRGSEGRTALHWAARAGQLAIVRLLLEKGASINAGDQDQMTALHEAIIFRDKELIRLLLENGADVNARGGLDKSTALHSAARYRHEGSVRLLLEMGANIDAKDEYGETALHVAADTKNKELVRLLLEKGADINATDGHGMTVLYKATLSRNKGLIRLLLEKGADINAGDGGHGTALQIAAQFGLEGVFRLLLEMGADIHAKSSDGKTVLQSAVKSGHEGVVRLLLEMGAEINTKDEYGMTALYRAARYGYEGMFLLLLEMGADVNAKRYDGTTALHMITSWGHEGIIRLLLDRGADVNEKDKDGMTALRMAAAYENKGAVRLLLERGADTNTEDRFGRQALYVAARYGHEGAVRLLLEMGADVNAKNQDGMTALDVASAEGHEGVVELLTQDR